MDEAGFIRLVLANPVNREILSRLPILGLNDAWLVSGCLFQTAWNVLTGRDVRHGIKDYDIFYFDPDTSWEAEDAVIRQAASLFGDLDAEIEVKNQARVHLWYRERFGLEYPELGSSCAGIDRFLAPACMVGLQLLDGNFNLYAPYGLSDIADMTIRPNRTSNFGADAYRDKAMRWTEHWPELTIIEA